MSSVAPLTAWRDAGLAPKTSPADDTRGAAQASDGSSRLRLSLHTDLDRIEDEWRGFERIADCTPFQTCDWLRAWRRHIGSRNGVRPVMAIARFADRSIAFMLPLAIAPGRSARRLCWMGQDVNDYNAPLLAPDFSERVTAEGFRAVWFDLCAQMQRDPTLRHDWIELEKMPQTIGKQINPFHQFSLAANPSGAHVAFLGEDWKSFYAAKRSSATRRRDRSKSRHLAEFGEVGFVTSADPADARRTLDTLLDQKRRLFARHGIPDVFAQPGWRDFFHDIAGTNWVHVSRLQVGSACAAANLGVVCGDSYYHILASYDDGKLSRYGPGALHLRQLMSYAIEHGLRRFDFTIGDEPYKREWADLNVALYDYARIATWRGAAAWLVSALRRPVKRFIKQTPWAWRAACRVRRIVGPLVRRSAAAPPDREITSAPAPAPAAPFPAAPAPLACVLGGMDLLRPLASAGIRCAVVARPGVPSLYSRFAQSSLSWPSDAGGECEFVEELVRFGAAQTRPPVLFYEEDVQLLAISRFRRRLAQTFRFVIADAELIEDLVDKARFQRLAETRDLPVPPARRFHPAGLDPSQLELRFPIVLKPLTRLARWNDNVGRHKALAADNAEALRALWPQLAALDIELLAQELVPGTEAQVESYHCYIDPAGVVVADFTGRKIRTYPAVFGHTTALEITDRADVRQLGRAIAERIGLTGVAKFDFKRDMTGRLHLLEINPRFTLWHHAGALAGVNIPAMVFADLAGMPRPAPAPVRSGVRWCRMWADFPAARAVGLPVAQWLAWTWQCEAKSGLSLDDPWPLFHAAVHRLTERGLARTQSRHRGP